MAKRKDSKKAPAEQERVEELLLLLQRAVEQTADGIALADLDGNLLYTNPVWAAMHGYTPDELQDQHLSIFHTEEQLREEVIPFNERVTADGSNQGEVGHVRKDGTTFPTIMTTALLRDEAGNPVGLVGTARDITEQKQAEEALRENEERFEAIYEGSNDAIMLLTPEGFFDCNTRTLEMFGFQTKEEFTAVHPADVSPPSQPDGQDSTTAAGERIQTAYQQGYNRFEWVHRRTNGEDFAAEVLLSAFDFGGETVLQATVRDITERKRAEQLLGKRVKELNCLTDISHRIDEAPPIPELLQWATERIPPAMQYPEDCAVAIEFEGQVYGVAEAVSLPCQMVQSLRIGGQQVGQAYIAYTEEHEFLDEESALLGGAVRRVSGYIENQRLIQEARARAREMVVLNELGQALTTRLSMEDVLNEAYQQVSRLLDTTNFYIGLYDPEKEEIRFVVDYTESELDMSIPIIPAGQGLAGHIISTRQPLFIEKDVVKHQRELGITALGKAAQCYLGVPLIIGDQVLGAMAIQSYTTPRLYDEHDRDLLSAIASATAIAIQNAQLFEQTQTALTETDTLYSVGQAIGQLGTLEETFQALAEVLTTQLGYTNAWLALVDREEQVAQGIAGAGEVMGDANIVKSQEPLDPDLPTPLVQAILSRQTVVVGDVTQDSQTAEGWDILGHMAFTPIMAGEQAVGAIVVDRTLSTHEIVERDVNLLDAVARQAAVAYQNARLFDQIQRRALWLQTATEVSRAASTILDPNELMQQVVNLVRDRFDLYYTGLFLVEQSDNGDPARRAVLRVGTGDAGRQMVEAGHSLEIGGVSMIGQSLATRQPQIAMDVGDEAMRFDNPLLPNTRTELALPLVSRGRPVGALTVQSDQPAAFSDEDIAVLQSMADQLATSLDNARLFQESDRRITELSIVNEIGQAVSAIPDLDELLEVVHQQVNRIFDTVNFFIAAYHEDTNEWTMPFRQERGQRLPNVRRKVQAGLTSYIIRYGKPLLLRTVEESQAFKQTQDIESLGEQARSWMGVPLIAADKIIGVMAIQSYEQEHLYDEQDLALFSTIADQVAIAFANLQLLEEMQRRALWLQTATEVSRTASTILDSDELMQQVVNLVRDRFDLYYTGLFLVEQSDNGDPARRAVLRVGTGDAGRQMVEAGHSLEIGGVSMIGQSLATRQPQIAMDVGDEAARFDNPLLPNTRTELALPLVSRGQPLGALTVQSDQPAAFSDEDIAVLQNMADQLATSLDNARLFQESDRRITELSIVNEIGQAVSSTLELDSLLEAVYKQIGRLFDTTNFYIASYYENVDEWDLPLHMEQGQRVPSVRSKVTAGATGYIIRNRQPLLSRSTEMSIAFEKAQGFQCIGARAKSWLGVPLIAADAIVGVMAIQSYEQEHLYDEQDLALFSTIADQVALGIANLRLLEETRRHTFWLQTATEVSRAASTILDSDELMQQVVNLVRDRFDLYYTGLFLVEQGDNGDPARRAALRVGTGDAGRQMVEAGHSLEIGGVSMIGQSLATRQPQIAMDVGDEAARFDNPLLPNTRTELALPLVSRGQPLGALTVQSDQPAAFSQEDIAVLQNMADQLATAIDNARLIEQTQTALAETDTLYSVGQAISQLGTLEETFQALAEVLTTQLGYTNAWLALVDREEQVAQGIAGAGEVMGDANMVKSQEPLDPDLPTPLVQAILSRQTVVVGDVTQDSQTADAEGWDILGHMAFTPIMAGEQAVGAIVVDRILSTHEIVERDVNLLDAVARQAAVAYQNARLFDQIQRRALWLQTATEVSRAASTILDPNELMQQVVNLVRDRFDLYYAGLFLVEQSDNGDPARRAVLRVGTGDAGRQMVEAGHSLEIGGVSMIGQSLATRQPQIAMDVGDEAARFDNPLLPNTRTELALPLVSRGRPIGALTVQSDQQAAFSQEDVAVLQNMADQLATAIDNARLIAQARTRAEREQRVRAITDRVHRGTDTETIMRITLEELGQLLGASKSVIRLGTQEQLSAQHAGSNPVREEN